MEEEEEKKVGLEEDEEDEEDEEEEEEGEDIVLRYQPNKKIEEVSGIEEDEEEEEDDDDVDEPSSFGTIEDENSKSTKNGKSPFASLTFATTSLLSTAPSKLMQSFSTWKQRKLSPSVLSTPSSYSNEGAGSSLVSFPIELMKSCNLRVTNKINGKYNHITKMGLKKKACVEVERDVGEERFNILSWHTPLPT